MGISGFPHTDAALGMDTEVMSGPLSNVESFLTVSKDSRAIKKKTFSLLSNFSGRTGRVIMDRRPSEQSLPSDLEDWQSEEPDFQALVKFQEQSKKSFCIFKIKILNFQKAQWLMYAVCCQKEICCYGNRQLRPALRMTQPL